MKVVKLDNYERHTINNIFLEYCGSYSSVVVGPKSAIHFDYNNGSVSDSELKTYIEKLIDISNDIICVGQFLNIKVYMDPSLAWNNKTLTFVEDKDEYERLCS